MKSRPFALFLMLTAPGCVALMDLCEVDSDSPNRLGDGDFASLTCWSDGDEQEDWQHGYPSSDTDSPISGAPVFLVPGSEAQEPFASQLLQGRDRTPRRRAGLGLEDGDIVQVRFWAVADQTPRSVFFNLTDNDQGWVYEEVPLNTEWTAHSVETTLVGGEPSEAFLDLQLAGSSNILIDDISLEVVN